MNNSNLSGVGKERSSSKDGKSFGAFEGKSKFAR